MKAIVTTQGEDGLYNRKQSITTAEFKSQKNLVKFNKVKRKVTRFEIWDDFNKDYGHKEPDRIIFV